MPYQPTPFNIPKKQFSAPNDPGAAHSAQTLQSIVQSINSTASIPSWGSAAAKGLTRAMESYDKAAQRSYDAYNKRREANQKQWDAYNEAERRVSGQLVGILARGQGAGSGSGSGEKEQTTELGALNDEIVKRFKALGTIDPNIAKRKITFEGGIGYSDTNQTRRFRANNRLSFVTEYSALGGAMVVSDKALSGTSTVSRDDLNLYPAGVFTNGPDGEAPAMRVRIERRREQVRTNPITGAVETLNLSQLGATQTAPVGTTVNTYYVPEPNFGARKKGAQYLSLGTGSYQDAEDYDAAKAAAAADFIANRNAANEAVEAEGGEVIDPLNAEQYMNIWRELNAANRPQKFNEDAPVTRGQAYLKKILSGAKLLPGAAKKAGQAIAGFVKEAADNPQKTQLRVPKGSQGLRRKALKDVVQPVAGGKRKLSERVDSARPPLKDFEKRVGGSVGGIKLLEFEPDAGRVKVELSVNGEAKTMTLPWYDLPHEVLDMFSPAARKSLGITDQ